MTIIHIDAATSSRAGRGSHGRNHMVVWSTTTCAISQCLSPLQLWVRILLIARCSQYSIMW